MLNNAKGETSIKEYNVFCIIKVAIVAKGILHFCNYEFPKNAKAIAGTR